MPHERAVVVWAVSIFDGQYLRVLEFDEPEVAQLVGLGLSLIQTPHVYGKVRVFKTPHLEELPLSGFEV